MAVGRIRLGAETREAFLVADLANDRVVRWRAGAREGEVVAGGNGPGDRLDQLDACFVFPTVSLTWGPKTHRLFQSESREVVMSVLLYFKHGPLTLPHLVVRNVLLPFLMDAVWMTPQALIDHGYVVA